MDKMTWYEMEKNYNGEMNYNVLLNNVRKIVHDFKIDVFVHHHMDVSELTKKLMKFMVKTIDSFKRSNATEKDVEEMMTGVSVGKGSKAVVPQTLFFVVNIIVDNLYGGKISFSGMDYIRMVESNMNKRSVM